MLAAGAAAAQSGAAPAPSTSSASGNHLDLDYLKGYLRDAGGLLSAPARWDGGDWLEAGAVVGTGVGVYFGVDLAARKAVLRNRSEAAGRVAGAGEALGNGLYLFPALGVAYLGGEAAHEAKLRRAALDAVESLALSGIFVTVVKDATGRDRPYVNGDHAVWNGPSSGDGRHSFPSGHSSDAFSVATIFAIEYGDCVFVPPTAYALATLTAVSRVYQDKHWASDVFAGGVVGYFTAKYVAAAHRAPGTSLSLVPWLDGGASGARLVYRFE